jgi:uncharacterized protein (UPF0261 family)
VLLPTRAISVISAPGQKFHDPMADRILFTTLKSFLRKDVELVEMDCVINAPEFAQACAEKLLANVSKHKLT